MSVPDTAVAVIRARRFPLLPAIGSLTLFSYFEPMVCILERTIGVRFEAPERSDDSNRSDRNVRTR